MADRTIQKRFTIIGEWGSRAEIVVDVEQDHVVTATKDRWDDLTASNVRLVDGRPVRRVSKGVYDVGGERFTSSDPDAP